MDQVKEKICLGEFDKKFNSYETSSNFSLRCFFFIFIAVFHLVDFLSCFSPLITFFSSDLVLPCVSRRAVSSAVKYSKQEVFQFTLK
jgi:hypothetical protein